MTIKRGPRIFVGGNLESTGSLHFLKKYAGIDSVQLELDVGFEPLEVMARANVQADWHLSKSVAVTQAGLWIELKEDELEFGLSVGLAVDCNKNTIQFSGEIGIGTDLELSASMQGTWKPDSFRGGLAISNVGLEVVIPFDPASPFELAFMGDFDIISAQGKSDAGRIAFLIEDIPPTFAFQFELDEFNLDAIATYILGPHLGSAWKEIFDIKLLDVDISMNTDFENSKQIKVGTGAGQVDVMVPPGFVLDIGSFDLWGVLKGSMDIQADADRVSIAVTLDHFEIADSLFKVSGFSGGDSKMRLAMQVGGHNAGFDFSCQLVLFDFITVSMDIVYSQVSGFLFELDLQIGVFEFDVTVKVGVTKSWSFEAELSNGLMACEEIAEGILNLLFWPLDEISVSDIVDLFCIETLLFKVARTATQFRFHFKFSAMLAGEMFKINFKFDSSWPPSPGKIVVALIESAWDDIKNAIENFL